LHKREVIAHLLDPGDVSPRSRFYDLYYQTLENLDDPEIRLLFRFDGGITLGEIIEFLINEGHLNHQQGDQQPHLRLIFVSIFYAVGRKTKNG
jgi:hypothetical protein